MVAAVAAAVEVPHKHVCIAMQPAAPSWNTEHRDNSSINKRTNNIGNNLRHFGDYAIQNVLRSHPFQTRSTPPAHNTPRDAIVLSERPAPQWTVTTLFCVRICPTGVRRRGRKNSK
ncbi:unnamed protein product [Ectocarpus sp. 4 AP-2014]